MVFKGVDYPLQCLFRELGFRHVGKVSGKAIALFCNDGVEDNIGVREVLLAATHAELKFVTGKCKRTCAVPVGIVAENFRQCRYAQVHLRALCLMNVGTAHKIVDNCGECIAQED